MALPRLRTELQTILSGLSGVTKAYFQPPQNVSMTYPCIVYERDDSFVLHADDSRYFFKKRYQVTVIDRNPDSAIPDLVEALPYTRFNRFFVADGLNHFVYQIFF